MLSAVLETSVSRLAPSSAAATALRQSDSVKAGKRLVAAPNTDPPLDELRKPGDCSRDFTDHLVTRDFARIAEDFLAQGLDLLHAKAEAHQFRAERHQSAPAHRPCGDAH